MNRRFFRSMLFAMVFCLVSAGVARAEGGTTASASSPSTSFWGLVAETWNTLAKVFQEEGSSLDPFGKSETDEGSSLDPFGRPSGG